MKFENKLLRKMAIVVLSLLSLAFLTSCEKEDEQVISSPPENIVGEFSQVAELMLRTAKESSENISCVTFQYPIQFFTYNTEFQIADTITIEDDSQLENLMLSLNDFSIITNDFPMTLLNKEKELIANNNDDLVEILLNAPLDCNTNLDCTLEKVLNSIKECPLYISEYNNSDNLNNYRLKFSFDDNTMEVLFFDKIVNTGTYSLSKDNDAYLLNIESDWDVIDGVWSISDCGNFSNHMLINNDNKMHLQGCSFNPESTENPLLCFKDFADEELCDENLDNNEAYNLRNIHSDCENSDTLIVTYHNTKIDAEQNVNSIISAEDYVITSKNTKIYSRVTFINNINNFQVNEIHLGLINCNVVVQNECTVDSTRNQFWECQMTINSYNGDTNTYDNYKLDFAINDDAVLFFVNNEVMHNGEYIVSQKEDGTFSITINADVPEFDGTWDIDDCTFSTVVNLTKGSDNLSLTGCE